MRIEILAKKLRNCDLRLGLSYQQLLLTRMGCIRGGLVATGYIYVGL